VIPGGRPEDDHVVAHVRTVLAEGRAHHLSVRVEVDGDAVVLRGPVESRRAHELVLAEVRLALADAARPLRIVDELHVPTLEDRPPEAIP
jgi:hypothetical protein